MSLLATYLNDHLAGAMAGRELARRAAGNNRGSSYAPLLERLAMEIEEDRQSLLAIMRALNIGVDPVKVLGGWGAEKLGRFKLNGRMIGYSPLSRLIEHEGLALGVTGKLSLWRALHGLGSSRSELAQFDVAALIERAERQRDELEIQRLQAAAEAFG